ncbi:heterodisulfide reductase-related iron-sulfur binding cluster [Rhodococcus sp. IEGM 1401]|uniref:heterodisulfide reductase-related iron-sulfur binding cluster n=1 Tax=unclassified Rhodococcus (in: high G+C Gram-positive bacteria) TaxID=192944 RepID=UPI0022B57B00|nr:MULTISPECIES: heterodisulfide reductase-related iron-sulfur binding cluster [unclassified Rhodococcus (in: high G+C Gram-positive bacteria)]MCZ4561446.1 heterodisulfide reductase-related iron-sulfur binding cluster [Rhodococcus sp. IEGM 1401]MDI9921674.1 heterodisulfide reductase-related iron-sulfur binding cluster [Rhodococcus sp. IEGM 1372]MDV8034126.1 heterodisulfide reductase-related iron-sulfur binding cluster [Rhodococcus sp. IEGM 1414]
MNALTITLGTVGALLSLVCWYVFIRGALRMFNIVRLGQPAPDRWRPIVPRFKQMVVEFLLHTKMVKFRTVGWSHWLVMVGFMFGSIVWFEAYGQTFNPEFHWPIFGDTAVYHFLEEILALGTVIGIVTLIVIRQLNHPRKPERQSRFAGSGFKAAYFVEAVVLIEGLGMLMVKSGKIATYGDGSLIYDFATVHIATLLPASPEMVSVFAFVKLMSGMVWLYIVGTRINWGIAWHRFSAFPNIYFKRMDDGTVALGPAKPMMSGGKVLEMEEADPDVDAFGAGNIEDFSWKGWLDFSTCTECGRCQSQCPAWNTGKPLSPKLLIMSLRDHSHAKAPYLLAGGKKDMAGDEVGLVDSEGNVDQKALDAIPQNARDEADRKLVADAIEGGIIDPEVLWSCTTCGACVEQCPVDIEHVDHIIDMRRYQVLIESEFPSELAGLFKNLENKGNPWGQNSKDRLNWINEMDFDIPVFGQDADSFQDYEYLFWVGCAGAYEDRAKKTTKAVAELLATAGVKFMVLGADETCTGDSARRAGNEFLFQQLAMQNIETLNSVFDGVEQSKRKIVVTCAHCFNALGNEYPQVGGDYEVVHHTQLLNRLVRQKKLIPVASVSQDITYHDPCYLGRHNKVYDAPRELMAASGSNLKEMPRHGERSMCCGAGGARMWMEENIGKRINIDRVDEALATNPKKIATGCPFCRVMLTDGVTARQEGGAHEGVEVVDVAQLMLESITRVESSVLGENIKVIPRERTPEEKLATEKAMEVEEAERIAPVEEPAEAKSAPAAPAPKAGGGLKMKGLAKAPGAKAPGSATKTEEPTEEAAPAAKPKGLGLAGGKAPGGKAPGGKGLQMKGKAPGAKAAAPADTAAEAPSTEASESTPSVKPKGLAVKSGFKKPGAKAPGKPAEATATPATEPSTSDAPVESASAATESKPTVQPKGLAVKSGFKKPGAKAPGKPAAEAPVSEAPAAEAPAAEAPAAEAPVADATASEAPAAEAVAESKPTVKPKGLAVKSGFKKPGARTPGAAASTSAEASDTTEAPAEASAAEAPAEAPAEASTTEAPAEASDTASEADDRTPPKPKAGGLGFAPGAKVPGRRK